MAIAAAVNPKVVFQGDFVCVHADGTFLLDCCPDEDQDAIAELCERVAALHGLLVDHPCEPEPVIIDTYTDRLGVVWTIRDDGSWTSGTGLHASDWKPTWHEATHFTKRIADLKKAQERN